MRTLSCLVAFSSIAIAIAIAMAPAVAREDRFEEFERRLAEQRQGIGRIDAIFVGVDAGDGRGNGSVDAFVPE